MSHNDAQRVETPTFGTYRKEQLKLLDKIFKQYLKQHFPSLLTWLGEDLTSKLIKTLKCNMQYVLQRQFYNSNHAFEIPPWENPKAEQLFLLNTPQDWITLTTMDINGLTHAASSKARKGSSQWGPLMTHMCWQLKIENQMRVNAMIIQYVYQRTIKFVDFWQGLG